MFRVIPLTSAHFYLQMQCFVAKSECVAHMKLDENGPSWKILLVGM
jgi:hypothetical protein